MVKQLGLPSVVEGAADVKKPVRNELRLPAVEVSQSPGRKLYSFAVDGKLVPQFATVSRVKRNEGGKLKGYQRPEVLSHIESIRNYLESPSPMIPNAVVIAFDSRVRFEPALGAPQLPYSRSGVLVVPLEGDEADEQKPGFIVDGQQRLAAIREAEIESFPLCVSAFITNDVRQQTEQFILVNSTKPLPRGLIYELLPSTDARLPALLSRRRLPAMLLEQLNLDEESPLFRKIQTATNPDGVIKDNSVLRMLENSLSDGALFRFKGDGVTEPDIEKMRELLNHFWGAVALTFKHAWDLPPKKSRLTHGAGIVSMGIIMDAVADRYREFEIPSTDLFHRELEKLKPVCRWLDGSWQFGPGFERKWNELQNTSKDIELLTNYLMAHYKGVARSRVVGT